MIQKFFAILACTLLSLGMVVTPAQAGSLPFSLPWINDADLTVDQQEFIEQLESKYIPQIEEILFPDQEEKFEQAIQDGYSLRKAFKSMALTSEQKSELSATLKTIPKRELFAALTPEQKKELFMSKKEMFRPTPEEIAEKIRAGMESKAGLNPDAPVSEFMPTPEEIAEKIKMGMDKKKEFMPSMEAIKEKISEKMEEMAE
ncbi:MAG: hypothetical protein HC922_04520 [Leptolyngbyaceae cyanobacterium SM2_3_12]|nr:hypothetical protein [Leptolyngbyaceae cyanobacterium SM2_3_12]